MRGKEDSGVKRHVSISVFLSIALCLIFCIGIVSAAPSIVAWSSFGGNPTYKDNPQDLIYKVQPGDTITFTVTANENCNFTWEVMLGAKALQTYKENNTKTSSFTWTVPNEISTWDIVVECFKKEREIGTNPAVYLSWTITTSQIIEVPEDGDIQSAIDSLPDEGGVVELSAGTYNPTSTIYITDRENITIRGAGNITWNTTLHYPSTDVHSFIVNNSQNIRFEHIYINMTWKGYESDTGKKGIYINWDCDSIALFKMKIEGTPTGFFTAYKEGEKVDYVSVVDCLFYNNKAGIFLQATRYFTMKNTTIYRSFGWSGIDFNGGNHHALVENCYFYDCTVGSVSIYSGSGDVKVKNCVIERSERFGGIRIVGSDTTGPSKVLNCIIKNGYHGSSGILISGIYTNDGLIIKNNIIYNNEGCGIKAEDERYSYPETWYIESNVIYGNGEHGICNSALENKNIIVKNNIIANNNGYGLTNSISSSKIISSYNNIYNNSLGMYNGIVTNKTGDISVNPLFANPENGDFHLKSEYGRWNSMDWVKDNITSPCIDAGDPADDYSNEPDYPNGRINLGAYGNTREASFGSSLSTGTLKGKVTDKDTGLPIVGATVTANSHQTTTNSTGEYIITNLPPGNYTVTASKDSYYSSTATVEILTNQTTTLNFQLTKDTTLPIISNITITSITQNSATITWQTDELATSLVKYGTTSGSYPYSQKNTSYTTTHSITLTNLTPNTTYYFVVNSTDKANNSAQSTEHSFKTKELSNIVYVATDGTGDYNCDGKDDQIEINQAISYINSIGGGIVHLTNGTFIISDSINLSSNLIFEGEGTEKTTIKIEDGSTKENWGTIVGDGISNTIIKNLTIDGNKDNCPVPKGINSDVDAFHLYNSNNITVENVKMIDFWTDGVEFSHSSNSVVKDCEVIQAGHEGLRAFYSDNITFSNNYVYSAGTGNAGIRIYESSNCIVERNYFNVYGFGILINPQGGVPCGNNIYRDNYIEGHYGLPGIALWPWDTEVSNETFIRNIIARTDGTQEPYGHGIHLRTVGTASLKNIKIINNVINNAIKSGIYVEDGANVSNIVAKNNIIVNNGEYGIYGSVLSSYNDVWNNNAGNYGGGASAGKGDISADPLFASPPHDFHLKSQAGRWNGTAWVVDNVTSPCIDAGVPFEEDPVYGDYRNELPPNGSRINMGAYGNTKEASKSAGKTYSISGYVKYENGTGIFNAHVTNNRTSAEDYT
ncbi:hypothetical protein DRN89_01030, partial [archaeon]